MKLAAISELKSDVLWTCKFESCYPDQFCAAPSGHLGSNPTLGANLEVLMQEHQRLVLLLALLRNNLNYSYNTLPAGMPFVKRTLWQPS